MAVTKEKKKEVLDILSKAVKDSASIVLVNFHGLLVKDARELRKTLREKGVSFLVAKKTLVKKALADSKIAGDMPALPGELAIAYSADLLDPAREVYAFEKKLDKKVSIVGGVFEGKFMDQAAMTSIASIPGLKTLQAQFVNLINSPIQRFAVVLGAIAEKKG